MKNGHIKKIAMRPLVRKGLQNNDIEKDRSLSFFFWFETSLKKTENFQRVIFKNISNWIFFLREKPITSN